MLRTSKRKKIILLILIIFLVIMSIVLILIQLQKNQDDVKSNFILNLNQLNENEEIEEIVYVTKEKNKSEECIGNQYSNNKWRILIPKIKLDAPILEGTSNNVLRRGVGHFSNSSKWDGNVVLAAHNRGYKYNFFQEIKRLEIGDSIEYKMNDEKRIYVVAKKDYIKETDLSCLRDTKENKITLLTCLENMPGYRICIQAILKNEL